LFTGTSTTSTSSSSTGTGSATSTSTAATAGLVETTISGTKTTLEVAAPTGDATATSSKTSASTTGTGTETSTAATSTSTLAAGDLKLLQCHAPTGSPLCMPTNETIVYVGDTYYGITSFFYTVRMAGWLERRLMGMNSNMGSHPLRRKRHDKHPPKLLQRHRTRRLHLRWRPKAKGLSYSHNARFVDAGHLKRYIDLRIGFVYAC
jgi:hypothetical protein